MVLCFFTFCFLAEIFQRNLEIEWISLKENRITEVHENLFQNLAKLTEVDLSHNKLTTLPVNLFRENENLRKVNLIKNSLRLFTKQSLYLEMNVYINMLVCLGLSKWKRVVQYT